MTDTPQPQHPPDGEILRQIAQGNLARFDLFVDRHKRPLFAYILSKTPDRHRAEDLTQEVFLKAFRNPPAQLNHESARPWLLTLARHTVIDDHRARSSRPSLCSGELPDHAHHRDTPLERLTRADTAAHLRELIRQLPEEQRETLTLRIDAQLTYQQIADLTETPVQTVRSRMRYALDKLRHALSHEQEAHS